MSTDPHAPAQAPHPGGARPRPRRARAAGHVYWASQPDAFLQSLGRARHADLLVTKVSDWLPETFAALVGRGERGRAPRLLVTGRLRPEERATYESVFGRVVDAGVARLLPAGELAEALAAPHRDELFVAAAYDPRTRIVTLYKGTLDPVLVPLAWFDRRPGGPAVDPARLAVTDYGQTVQLGEYEAAADAVLYEFDPAYRRAAKSRLRGEDRSLGASIRRLRKQRGLRQGDFPGLPSRTVGRIERGEVEAPRRETLEAIASRLGVSFDELDSY